jgi:NAD(P) transhydrogenase
MEEIEYDVVVIGSGPAGQKSAIQAAKAGKSVIVVERSAAPGGSCLFSGTIPSKTLREAIIDLTRFNERKFQGTEVIKSEVTIPELNSRLSKVIEDEKSMLYRQFRRNNIRLFLGVAHFEDPHHLIVRDETYDITYRIKGSLFFIATGSKPRNPEDVPFDGKVIFDSTTLLQISKIPQTMLVLGGGIIGSEYASFFAALGTGVTIIDKQDHILPMLDREIGMHLQTGLTDIGLQFLGNKRPLSIERNDHGACVKFDDGTNICAETLLYALGRTANVDDLHIENAGVTQDSRGYIIVNALFQTVAPHIYAVGDVIGGPCLASTSMEQGRLASRHACGEQTHYFPSVYPIGIYTIPEISSIGYTEDELKELGYHYEVGRAYYYEIARSHIAGSDRGLIKILFHKDTLEILGVHAIGRGATEVIHIGQVAMSFRATIDYFTDHVFNYPTYAEGYRVAALNGLNKIKDARRPRR